MKDTFNILIIDDNPLERKRLTNGLTQLGYDVEAVGSGEEAIRLIKMEPMKYNFTLIDHLLFNNRTEKLEKRKLNGINTCTEIQGINGDIINIIYTNNSAGTPKTFRALKHKAYEAGAMRYIEKSQHDPEIQIHTFLSEIEDIKKLSKKISKFQEYQKEVPSLLNNLNAGIMLIDEHNKIWFTNQEMREIMALPQGNIHGHCAEVLHGFKKTCDGCLLKKKIKRGQKPKADVLERVSLQPVKGLKNRLKYLNILNQPVISNNRIIAVMKLAQDLTHSHTLKNMNFKKRLNLIARGLGEHERGFDKVLIYEVKRNKLSVKAVWNYDEQHIDRIVYKIEDSLYLEDTIKYFKREKMGKFYKSCFKGNRFVDNEEGPFIQWPIFDSDNLIGLLVVSGTRNKKCSENKLDIVGLYAEEVSKAIKDSRGQSGLTDEIESMVLRLQKDLIQKSTSEQAIEFLMTFLIEETESVGCHIRLRQDSRAVIFPIRKGPYSLNTAEELVLSEIDTVSTRVLMSRQEYICNDLHDDSHINDFIRSMGEMQKKSFENIKSFCYMPLIFMDDCIGVVSLQSLNDNNYDNRKRSIIREVSKNLSLAVHDYQNNEKERMAKRIEEQKNRLEEENRIKSELLSILSHELNSPMTFLLSFSDSLLKTKLDDKQKRMVYAIHEDVHRYKRLVDKILYYNWLESDKVNDQKKELSLNKLARDCIRIMQVPANSKNFSIHLEEKCNRADDIFYGNEDLLIQGIINLLDNAVKFTPKNGQDVNVSIGADTEKVELSVTDRGPGISGETKEKVFEKFFQGDQVYFPQKYGGSGLGLYIFKSVINIHKGEIIFSSDFGKGTTLGFRLKKIF